MAKKRPKRPTWDLPDWQVQILLSALTDHELMLKIRERSSFPYRTMLDQVRANLQDKPK